MLELTKLQNDLRELVRSTAAEKFGVTLENVSAEIPPRTELGDLAFPVAFELAKRIKAATGEKKNPRAIAEELRLALAEQDGIDRVEVAGAGYLNVFFDRALLLAKLTAEAVGVRPPDAPPSANEVRRKLIVEHTNINPNKAAHIGHLRNAVLGDTFVRVLRAAGEEVEVQNYIDNTGVQVADVVVGFLHIEKMALAHVKQLDESLPPDYPFDYYCWDLYAKVGVFYRRGDTEAKEDAELLKLRSETLHAIEVGDNPTAELADYVATRIVQCHLRTMERLGVRYDVLPRESEILHLNFWGRAFDLLKSTGAIRFESEGRNAGCWVMPTDLHTGTEEHDSDKIIVRSNNTVTYAGKDIAYQLWKLGQLGLDFHYRPFHTYPDGHIVWITTTNETQPGEQVAGANGHSFGGGHIVYNVIDSRQTYTQDVVRRGVAAVAPTVGDKASVHLDYDMVALSPAACAELGIELSAEDRARPFIEMSGRRGLGVKGDDLINQLIAGAHREVAARHADLADDEQLETARVIAIGALRYFLLKWTRNSIIAFDFADALSFEGESGPYCQYTAVRANSIFRKLETGGREAAQELISGVLREPTIEQAIREIFAGEGGDDLWALVSLAARLDETVAQSATQAEPAYLAKYAFQLARSFNLFYHRHKIIAEQNPTRRAALIAIADLVRNQLTSALGTLGIQVPERM